MPLLISTVILVLQVVFVAFGHATPWLSFAINSQIPSVAYVSLPFEYAFSSETFSSTNNSEIQYSLTDNPTWLSIDSKNRRLYGTPRQADAGSTDVVLVASDADGQSTDTVTLVILDKPTISRVGDVFPQLETVGDASTPDALLLRPLESFRFRLAKTIFDGTVPSTRFYAVSSDGSPLPSWVQFDPMSLEFSGLSPSLPGSIPSREEYSIKLTASNVVGFSEAAVTFQIMVFTRLLVFSPPRLTINLTPGHEVSVPSMLEHLSLDGSSVSRDYLTAVVSSAPEWLILNVSDLSFAAMAPADVESFAFEISVKGRDDNAANATIIIKVPGSNIVESQFIGIWNATVGHDLWHPIPRPLGIDLSTPGKANLGPLASWLEFDSARSVLYGPVPVQQALEHYNISISFTSASITKSIIVTLNVVSDSAVATTSATCSPSGSSGATDHGCGSRSISNWSSHDRAMLGLEIGLPLLGTLLLIILFVCIRRYRSKKLRASCNQDVEEASASQVQQDGNQIVDGSSQIRDLDGVSQHPTDRVPQVRLSWAVDHMKPRALHGSDRSTTPPKKPPSSTWDDLISPSTRSLEDDVATVLPIIQKTRQHQSRQAPSPSRWRYSQHLFHPNTGHDLRTERTSQTTSVVSMTSVGAQHRVSGAGHGAGINATLHPWDVRSSWYTTFGSIPIRDKRHSDTILNSFPVPPSYHNVGPGMSKVTDLTVRPRSRQHPELKQRRDIVPGSFEDARQRYYTERARDRLEGASRFSNNSDKSLGKGKMIVEANPSIGETCQSNCRLSVIYPTASWSSWSTASHRRWKQSFQPMMSLRRESSLAGSGQFDSALSSDSQWEDEDLGSDENTVGGTVEKISNLSRGLDAMREIVNGCHSPGSAGQGSTTNEQATEKNRSGSFRFV